MRLGTSPAVSKMPHPTRLSPDSGGMANLVTALADKLKRVGYDSRIGPVGSFTYKSDRTNPVAAPFMNWPLGPGFVGIPEDRPLSKEDIAHEGAHVTGGFPTWLAGVLGAKSLGVEKSGGYLAPDEVMAYLSQPKSEETSNNLGVVKDVAAGAEGNRFYRTLVELLAGSRAK